MAIIECSECGNKMSEHADICPNCGCPNRLKKARLRALHEEEQRVISIHNTIEYYENQLFEGLATLIISLLLGFGYCKLTGYDINVVMMFLLFVLFTWCQFVMDKYPVGIIGAIFIIALIFMGIVKVFGNSPELIQNIIVLIFIIYPVYYTIIRPLINIFKIRGKKKEL